MTFLGLEQPVAYGRQLVFDPTTALMVLNANRDYINAVYRDYMLAQLDMKDFLKEYGNFISPIQADMEWYDKNVTGNLRDFIDNLYATGLDPLRTAEGRAAVTRKLATMPIGEIAMLRQSAEAAKRYLDTYDDDTNPELEKFLGRDLNSWSTLGDSSRGIKANGVWNTRKAAKYLTVDDLIEPIVKNIDYSYDDALTKSKSDGNDYYTITKDRLLQAVNDNLSDILATPSGRFHYQQALNAANGNEEQARNILNTVIGNRLSDHERVKSTPNQFKLDDHRTANDISAYGKKATIDYEYKIKEASDPRLGGGKGRGKDSFDPNIFREAEANADAIGAVGVGGSFGYGVQTGEHVGYIPSAQYKELIDPIIPGSYVLAKDENSGQVVETWKFDKKIQNGIYTIDENGKARKVNVSDNYDSSSYRFVPDGQIRAAKAGNSYRYYVSGQLKGDKNTSPIYDPRNKSTQLWIEVKERAYAYDGK